MSRKHLETSNGNDQLHPFLKGWRSQLRLHMGSQTWSSFGFWSVKWFDVQPERQKGSTCCESSTIWNVQAVLWTRVYCQELNGVYVSWQACWGWCDFLGPSCHNTPHLVISCSAYGKVVHLPQLPTLSTLALMHSHATKVHVGGLCQSER